MATTAFLCAGEAASRVGMGVDFVVSAPQAADVFELAADATGLEVYGLCATGPDSELQQPQNASPCVVTTALAAAAALQARGVHPQALAGYGAGEYAALALAGVIDQERALQLAARRGAMLALASAQGEHARASAERNMELAFKGTLFAPPELALYGACTGGRFEVADACAALSRQMFGAPLVTECIAAMLADGVERFVVCGPDAGYAGRVEHAIAQEGGSADVVLVGSAADVEALS